MPVFLYRRANRGTREGVRPTRPFECRRRRHGQCLSAFDTIKQSKTDPFRKGINLFVGRTNSALCPVAAILDFFCVRGKKPGPPFIWEDGRPLTRSRFAEEIRDALSRAGVDRSRYCTHSFWIRAATTAPVKGIEDFLTKISGRWESTVYLQYVRIPRSHLSVVSNRLIQ